MLLPVSGTALGEPTDKVEATIWHLIEYVSNSDLTFIRNDREYNSRKAAEHMNKKYEHFREAIETPDDFIEMCANKSLLTGKPYLVIDQQGRPTRTSDWLRAELRTLQVHSQ